MAEVFSSAIIFYVRNSTLTTRAELSFIYSFYQMQG